MTYNPNILRDVLRARSLSRNALSERLQISAATLDGELEREPQPKQSLLNDIAKELALPPFVFFMKVAPSLDETLPDFRSATPRYSAKLRPTIEAIQFALSVQKSAVTFAGRAPLKLPYFDQDIQSVEDCAHQARKFFGITISDQVDAKDARSFYTLCRKKIEDKGIFVLHDSFPAEDGSGFCLAHASHPLILINTKQQTRGRRLFTLIHELGHVLLKKSGISDPFIRQNSIETLCNRFAGSFLVPRRDVSELLQGMYLTTQPGLDDVARASRRLKISQQAAVLRLEQLRIFDAGSHNKWRTAIHNVGNPDYSEKGGGSGGPPPQEKVKLSKYGFRFANVFDAPLREGTITEINLFRSTGLKPKYQRIYFDYAKSITDSELPSLELEDD